MRTRTLLAAMAVSSVAAGIACATLIPSETPRNTVIAPAGMLVSVPALPDLMDETWPPAGSVECEEEDGSGPQKLPCYWGDGTIGVKGGLSYLVTQGQYGRDSRCFHYRDPQVRAEFDGCE